jgi:hypothetical protein
LRRPLSLIIERIIQSGPIRIKGCLLFDKTSSGLTLRQRVSFSQNVTYTEILAKPGWFWGSLDQQRVIPVQAVFSGRESGHTGD